MLPFIYIMKAAVAATIRSAKLELRIRAKPALLYGRPAGAALPILRLLDGAQDGSAKQIANFDYSDERAKFSAASEATTAVSVRRMSRPREAS